MGLISWLSVYGEFMNEFDYIRRNYLSLCEELNTIAEKSGCKSPTLVCVTKSGTDDELLALAAAGASDIGENRPGEVKRRGEILRGAGFSPKMHEIGSLQTNKIKLIADTVHLVHSLDSHHLAKELDKRALASGRKIPVLVEINSAREEQKGGILPEAAEEFIASLVEYKNLSLKGLMTMGPLSDEGEALRPYFRLTKKLFDSLSKYYDTEKPILSMGMSDSYKVAIEEGSTLVRVGRRLFIK